MPPGQPNAPGVTTATPTYSGGFDWPVFAEKVLFATAAAPPHTASAPPPNAELPEMASPEGGPDEQAEQAYTAWRVHRALEELNPNEREVIELAYWSGLSQSEVAERLSLPLGTVKTRTRSGLARLATRLADQRVVS